MAKTGPEHKKARHWRIPVFTLLVFVPLYLLFILSRFNFELTIKDNLSHYTVFAYICNYIKLLGALPTWLFTRQGGLWIETFTNNDLLIVPYRWIGYVLAGKLGVNPLHAYLLSCFFIGQWIFLSSLYLLCRELGFPQKWSAFAVVVTALSSPVLCTLHQEHAFGTIFFLPSIWIALIRSPRNLYYLPLAAALVGLSLNTHYPQYVFCYLLIGLVAFFPLIKKAARTFSEKTIKVIAVSIACLLLSASPLLYSYGTHKDEVSSAFRPVKDGVFSDVSYDDYVQMNLAQQSSIPLQGMASYLYYYFYEKLPGHQQNDFIFYNGIFSVLDERAIFVHFLVLPILIIAFLVKFPWKKEQLIFIGALFLLTMGIHGPMPRLLWFILPGIRVFRQWGHFMAILNLHLIVLSVFVLMQVKGAVRSWGAILQAVLVLGIVLGNVSWVEETVAEYQRASMHWRRLDGTEGQSAPDLLLGRATMTALQLANPKGLTPMAKALFRGTQGLSWHNGTEQHALEETRVGVKDGEFTVDLNGLPSVPGLRLLLWQYNDGHWNITDEGGGKITTPHDPTELLSIPLKPDQRRVRIAHEASVWHWLIFLEWIPLLGSVVHLKRAREVAA